MKDISRSYEGPADAHDRFLTLLATPVQQDTEAVYNSLRVAFRLGIEAALEQVIATPETWRGDGKYDNSWSACRQNAIMAIGKLL